MPKTVKYIGTVTRWPELATTGKQSTWVPGQQEQRSDTEAAQLLATGLFSDVDATQLPEQKVVAISGVVSKAWNRRGGAPFLVKRKATLLSGWAGKVKSVANAADYCTRVFRTLECDTDRARVWVLNPIAADLVNVRVSLGTSDTMPADLASLHGSTTTAGAILSNGALATSVAFTVAAGTSVTRVKATPSEWLDIRTVPRADGGILPAVRVTIEIPTSGNPDRPAYDTASTRAGWESQGDADTAPYGRCYKARNGAGLGATTPGAGSSTVWSDETIPFIIEYVPRGGTAGLTMLSFCDSTGEGVGADIYGHGWLEEARALMSSTARPMEVCNLSMANATLAEIADRVEAVAADLSGELAILQMFSSNGITAPNFTVGSTAPTQRRATQRARAALAAAGTAVIGTPGIPLSTSFKDLDATSAAVLNAHVAAIRSSAGSMPVIDTYGPMIGTTDADGQVSALSSAMADAAHPNTVGHRDLIAPQVVVTLAQMLMS